MRPIMHGRMLASIERYMAGAQFTDKIYVSMAIDPDTGLRQYTLPQPSTWGNGEDEIIFKYMGWKIAYRINIKPKRKTHAPN